ncbi:MAG: hypothetical protein MJ078_06060, partial [Clostridia bacterium]|nr:hypothetical protein [Clostridia bacterium]
ATLIEGLVGDTPVVAGEENICKVCGVATLSINYYDLGKTTGEMAIKILKGQAKVSDMKIEYTTAVKKYNAAKCQALGINPTVLEGLGYIAID